MCAHRSCLLLSRNNLKLRGTWYSSFSYIQNPWYSVENILGESALLKQHEEIETIDSEKNKQYNIIICSDKNNIVYFFSHWLFQMNGLYLG